MSIQTNYMMRNEDQWLSGEAAVTPVTADAFYPASGRMTYSTTETTRQNITNKSGLLHMFTTRFTTNNDENITSHTVQINGSATLLVVTIPADSAGVFETSMFNIVFLPGDILNIHINNHIEGSIVQTSCCIWVSYD